MKTLKILCVSFLIGIAVASLVVLVSIPFEQQKKIDFLTQQLDSLNTVQNERSVQTQLEMIKDYMHQINLQHKDIVYAQLLLETGNLTSTLYKTNNNLFGMKVAKQRPTSNINSKGYAKYNTWQESVLDYALWQVKYAHNLSETEYLQFLAKYYAKDKEYINKLKKIIK